MRLERKEVGLKARPKGSSNLLLARGRLNKGFMASNGQATNKIKKFLENEKKKGILGNLAAHQS